MHEVQLRTETSSSSEYVRASDRTLPALPSPQLLVGLRSGLLSGVNTPPSRRGRSSGASGPGPRFSLPAGETTISRQASNSLSRLAAPASFSRRRPTRWRRTLPVLLLRRRRLPDSGMLGF